MWEAASNGGLYCFLTRRVNRAAFGYHSAKPHILPNRTPARLFVASLTRMLQYADMVAYGPLGLERYEAAFRANENDDTVLPRLTTEALSDAPCCPR